jgi:hypothetical protein
MTEANACDDWGNPIILSVSDHCGSDTVSLPPCKQREYKCNQRKQIFTGDQVELECRLCVCDCKGQA